MVVQVVQVGALVALGVKVVALVLVVIPVQEVALHVQAAQEAVQVVVLLGVQVTLAVVVAVAVVEQDGDTMANITTTLEVSSKDVKTGVVTVSLANDVKELLQNDIRINNELTSFENTVASALAKM